MSCSAWLDDFVVIEGAHENKSHGLNLGRCQLAVVSICRAYPFFALVLRKNSMGKVNVLLLSLLEI